MDKPPQLKTLFEPIEAVAVVRDRKGVSVQRPLFGFEDEVYFAYSKGYVRISRPMPTMTDRGVQMFYTSHPDLTAIYVEGAVHVERKQGSLGRLVPRPAA